MVVKRKDFQKTASYIHEFLLKLQNDWECAELRDSLNFALLHMQKYYCLLQTRVKENRFNGSNSTGLSMASSGPFGFQSLRGMSPMTPHSDCPDKWEWNWINLENSRISQKMFQSLNISSKQGAPLVVPIILQDCKRGDLDAIEQHLKSDPNCFSEIDTIGRTPLMYAVHYAQNHVVKWLLEHKQSPDVRAHDQSTALHHACHMGNAAATDCLLRFDANTELTDSYDRAAIHWAVTNNSTDCLKLLMKYQKKVNIVDQDGLTPCMWACRLDHLDHLHILCQGKIPKLKDDTQVERDHSGKTWIHWAVRRTEPLTCLKFILDNDSVTMRDEEGKTPLLLAAEYGSLLACKLIVETVGMEVIQQRDKQERSPLHLATIGGHGEVVNYLLEKGCEIYCQDKSMSTPWDYARSRQLHYCILILSSHNRQRNRENEPKEFRELNSSLSNTSGGMNHQDNEHKPPRPPTTPLTKSPTLRRSLKTAGQPSESQNGKLPKKKELLTETTEFDCKESEDLEYIPEASNTDPLSLSGRNVTQNNFESENLRVTAVPSRQDIGPPPKTARGRPSSTKADKLSDQLSNKPPEVGNRNPIAPSSGLGGSDLRLASQVPQLNNQKQNHLQRSQPPPMLHNPKPQRSPRQIDNSSNSKSHQQPNRIISSHENKIDMEETDEFDRLSPPPKAPLTPPDIKRKQNLPPQLIPLSMSGSNGLISSTNKFSAQKKRNKRELKNRDIVNSYKVNAGGSSNFDNYNEDNTRSYIKPLQPPGLQSISGDRIEVPSQPIASRISELKSVPQISPRSNYLGVAVEQPLTNSPRSLDLITPPKGFRNHSPIHSPNTLLSPRALGSLNSLPDAIQPGPLSTKSRSRSENRNFIPKPLGDDFVNQTNQKKSNSKSVKNSTNNQQSLFQRR